MRTVFVSVLVVLILLGAASLVAQKQLTPEQVEALKAAGFTKEQIAEMVLGKPATEIADTAPANTATIPRRTPVDIKIDESLDSGDTKVGPFKCSVDRDVKVNGVVVIAEKTPAVCRVVSIVKGAATIRKATIKIATDSTTAVDGSLVILDYNVDHGGGSMFGRFRSGTKITAGTILPAVVDEKVDVKIQSLSATKAEAK